jgi:hypothetical protein
VLTEARAEAYARCGPGYAQAAANSAVVSRLIGLCGGTLGGGFPPLPGFPPFPGFPPISFPPLPAFPPFPSFPGGGGGGGGPGGRRMMGRPRVMAP